MARAFVPLVASSPGSGSALSGVNVSIVRQADSSIPPIYPDLTSASNGTGASAITTDTRGQVSFAGGPVALDQGTYNFTFSGPNLTAWTLTREIVSGAGINLSLIATPTVPAGSATAVNGQLVVAAAGATITAPTATLGAAFEVLAGPSVNGTSPVTVAAAGGAVIGGLGVSSATSFLLGAPGAYATLQCHDGTNWKIVSGQQDTGWVALTLPANWALNTGYAPAFRVVGATAYLSGGANNNTGGTAAFTATLPAVARPASLVTCVTYAPGTGPVFVQVPTNGSLATSGTITAGSAISLDGLSYRLT